MTPEEKQSIIELKLKDCEKHQTAHKKTCSLCHSIELEKSTDYCPVGEGLKYWINALNWVLSL